MALSQWKEAILEGIFTEIEEGLVEEKNLERLENLVEILHKEGLEVPESVKESYCQVAVECTARTLADEGDAKEAIRSIWLRRVLPLCDKVSCLVTRDLLNSCKRLWKAYGDDEAYEALMDEDTREKALASLRKVVSELHPDIDCAAYGEIDEEMEECSVETRDTEATEEEDEEGRRSSDTEEERPCGGALEAESPPPRGMKTIASPVVAKALEKLRGSKVDLMNALAEGGGGGPSVLNAISIIQQESDVVDPAATNKLSLMEGRITAQTSEWKDLIDDFDGETGDGGEVRGERVVVSPWKRNQGGGKRTNIPWSTAETLAVMKGYEKYGANWKRIKDECPILVRRTNGDIKDKFRVEMKRQEGHP